MKEDYFTAAYVAEGNNKTLTVSKKYQGRVIVSRTLHDEEAESMYETLIGARTEKKPKESLSLRYFEAGGLPVLSVERYVKTNTFEGNVFINEIFGNFAVTLHEQLS